MSDSVRVTMTRGEPYRTRSGMSMTPIYLTDPASDRGAVESRPPIGERTPVRRGEDPRRLSPSMLTTDRSFGAALRRQAARLLRRFL